MRRRNKCDGWCELIVVVAFVSISLVANGELVVEAASEAAVGGGCCKTIVVVVVAAAAAA